VVIGLISFVILVLRVVFYFFNYFDFVASVLMERALLRSTDGDEGSSLAVEIPMQYFVYPRKT